MFLHREEERALLSRLPSKEALALTGPRRSGKTTLAKRLLEAWKARGGKGDYLDLEELGAPSTAAALAAILDAMPKGSLAVLDEVQALDGWVKAVRSQVETGKRHIMVSGSSASLLSSEIASSLGGRAIPFIVLPLSYRDARMWGIASLEKYMEVGGYPECVLRPGEAPTLHKLYLELTVLRDVAARKGIREAKPLSDLALLLLSEPGKAVSAAKTSARLGISQPTFRSYVQAFNDAFLILSVPPFLRSPRERIVADARHYAFDVGLSRSVSISASQDSGRRLENLVAVELFRRGYSLSYLRGADSECDFIAQKAGSGTLAVQVWSGDGKPPERECEGLLLGMRQCRAKGLLLSPEAHPPPKGASSLSIEDWLLEG